MPEGELRALAITRLDADLQARWPNTLRLDNFALARRFPHRTGLVASWRIADALPGPGGSVLVSVDSNFPWSLPRIALPEAPNGLSYPHIEVDGQICIAPASAVYELPVGIRHVESLVDDAARLLEQGRTRANDADFFSEAHSYWGLVESVAGSFLALNKVPMKHAVWASASCGANVLIADSEHAITTWAKTAAQKIGALEPALILALDEPLHPRNYPLTPRDLIELCERIGASGELKATVARWRYRAPLRAVLAFPHAERQVLLGAEMPLPSTVKFPGSRRFGIHGFRPQPKGTTARLAALAHIPGRFQHWKAISIQRDFLHKRTAGDGAAMLATCHVMIVGCGALGGQLATQLSQAGVGSLTLLDKDVLDWRNVGRHVLDGTSVGMNKAVALRDSILRRFPDAIVEAHARTWEEQFALTPEVFDQVDLIISATAEPASNLRLDRLSETDEVAPVVFGWMEPFAACSHAVFRHPSGAGLAELADTCGLLYDPVIDRETAPSLPQEPACGAMFQPYSSLNALSCVSLVGELSVDALLGRASSSTIRTWIGASSAFQDNGLSITPVWHTRVNRDGFCRRYDRPIVLGAR